MDSNETGDSEANEDDKSKPAIILRFIRTSFLKQFGCTACPCSYKHLMNLKYHIRREHFNLVAKKTNRNKRQINDVWLETVLNTDDIIEIKKAGPNKYLMKKSNNPDGVEVVESTDFIDMTSMYPDQPSTRRKTVWCCICNGRLHVTNYKKHLEEEHRDLIGSTSVV